MERRLRDAVERCVAMPSPLTRCAVPEALTRCDPSIFAPLERCLASSEHEERAQEGSPTNGNRNGNPVANGPAADADVEALRGRLDVALHEAEALRRQLRRTQTLCANQLFDVRTRCSLRVCFRALSAAPRTRLGCGQV